MRPEYGFWLLYLQPHSERREREAKFHKQIGNIPAKKSKLHYFLAL
jgi:hypothetical protein